MKSAPAEYLNKSAREEGHINTPEQLTLFVLDAPVGLFTGTKNPRLIRILNFLLKHGQILREEVDACAKVSNGPHVILELRKLGLELPCQRLTKIDSDGRACRPGLYVMTENDRKLVLEWLQRSKAA